jgi:hypothetical protein
LLLTVYEIGLCATELTVETLFLGLSLQAKQRSAPPKKPRAKPPPTARSGRAPGSNEPGGPRRRKQSRGSNFFASGMRTVVFCLGYQIPCFHLHRAI